MNKTKLTRLMWCGIAFIAFVTTGAQAEEPVTIESLLTDMVNRDSVARYPESEFRLRQHSSYNRASKTPEDARGWFTNHDYNSSDRDKNFIRIEEANGHKEWVLMDHQGPGAMVRIWMPWRNQQSAETTTRIRIYLDDAKEPTLEGNMLGLFNGTGLIPYPLAHPSLRSAVSFFPIPYARRCKVTTTERPFFFQFTFRDYAQGTPVKTFTMADYEAAKGLAKKVGETLLKPQTSGTGTPLSVTATLGENLAKTLVLPNGTASVRELMLKLGSYADPSVTRSVVVTMEFDGKKTVWCPVGDFFGTGIGLHPFQGWYRTVHEDGTMTCRWVMPYQNTGKVTLVNLGEKPVDVHLEVQMGGWQWDDRSLYFHAAWRGQYPVPTMPRSDWNYVTLTGRGVYVGDTLTVMNPVEKWWGEGDEKIWVDGEDFPSMFGTGTEDYYAYSWGGRSTDFYEHPFHAQVRCNQYDKLNRKTVDERNTQGFSTETRTRSLDTMPFDSSLQLDMEVWSGTDCAMGYGVGTYWYGDAQTISNRNPDPEGALSVPPWPKAAEPSAIDFESFLGQHDMVWDRVPNRWELAPYTGNGNVGFLFYQAKGEAKNVISVYTGRHDYYDHRLPYQGQEMLWIYRSRLPSGHFNLESKGDITGADLRLDLWNAELIGTVKTSQGSYAVRGLSHSTTDILYFETEATGGESITVTWHPDEPMPPVRATLNQGGGPRGGSWDRMRQAPMPMPPAPTWSEEQGMEFCLQRLYQDRGETTTGWEITGDASGKQILTASIHHSFPEHNSQATVKQNLLNARVLIKAGTCISSHQTWWHDYYPKSFLTINDPEKESFYWIQMYKLGSAMRENGPILDLMGPWYHKTFWPMVWGDLNVQLIYWTHLTANRMAVGESLPNNMDKYADNLANNVPEHWKDSASVAALMPQDLMAHASGAVPDMLAWMLNNYWLHCEFSGDRARMRDGLFPLLRKTGNSYLNYLKDNPVTSDDGKIHIKNSWSPEYPDGRGQDINFTIGLMRWCFQTLININEEHKLDDPLAPKWQDVLDHLVDFQIDENGLRIGKDIPFDNPHRHYSHLLPFYPLAVLTPDTPEGKKLLRTSLDHWLDVTFNRKQTRDSAMAVTGYTATGAASMYAMLADSEQAYHYLDFFIKYDRVSPTTMYAEGNPVIESPLSFATCIHDMLLQSWGGTIRVFPGTPQKWADVAFQQLRTQGAFLVSAKRKGGVTEFVTVKSLIGSPCVVKTDISQPIITINGAVAKDAQARKMENGTYQIQLKQGDSVTLSRVALDKADLKIEPIAVSAKDRNLFGYSKKTERLPGHQHYGK